MNEASNSRERLEAENLLGSLTQKQVEVLELGIRPDMSNKRIANQIGLSERAVEDRFAAARQKLGTSDRGSTLARYTELTLLSGQTTRGFSRIEEPQQLNAAASQSSSADMSQGASQDTPLSLIELDRRFGPSWRIAAILVSLLLIVIATFVLLAIADALEGLF